MKTFSVTYRGKDGRQAVVEIEAEDRQGVFPELAKRDISAIRVEEMTGKAKKRGVGNGALRNDSHAIGKPLVRGLVAGVLVVAAAVGAWLILFSPKSAATAEKADKKSGKIAEVTPAKSLPARSNDVVSANQEKPTVAEEPQKPLTVHDRLAKRKFGENNIVHTSKVQRVKSRYEIFKHRSENHLALLATIPMGASLVGTRRFDERFMKDLDAALSEKVEILPEDSEYDRNLNLAVEDLKDEIRKRKAAGEDIAKVLEESFKEVQKLGVYKHQIESVVSKTMREDATLTDQDVDDLVVAANQMLEAKGIAPIKVDKTLRSIVRSKARLAEGEKEK